MTRSEIEKRIEELKFERGKLYLVKSASPKEITDRVSKISRRIVDLEKRLQIAQG